MFTTLISVEELAQHLDDPDWVICDCRHDLARYEAGRRAYDEAHIPGARFLHLDEDLSGPKTGLNGRHPLPHPLTFALRLGALGIDNTKQVVAYDASGGCYAARLWWMLRWVGHCRCGGPRRRLECVAARRSSGHRRKAPGPADGLPAAPAARARGGRSIRRRPSR